MKMQEIRVMAKNFGIKASSMNKAQLIHSIQDVEGNFHCYASARNGECDQASCLWRDDCFVDARKKLNS
ncbi:MAG TPA: SAP domain-containing protein [Gammaproteobacteria bacterium]|nr:SAP domain-containing protein [Gammaproteobacteria bacterium]